MGFSFAGLGLLLASLLDLSKAVFFQSSLRFMVLALALPPLLQYFEV